MEIALSLLLLAAVVAFLFFIRPADLPPPEPVSPTVHLDQRKAQIYEGLRDLQFEYRLGKLSDADYQTAKKDLQHELAVILAEIDRVLGAQAPVAKAVKAAPAAKAAGKKKESSATYGCPHCGATFANPMKFCGECGKPMETAAQGATS